MRSPYLSIESMAQPNETRVRDKNFTCTQLLDLALPHAPEKQGFTLKFSRLSYQCFISFTTKIQSICDATVLSPNIGKEWYNNASC